MKAPWRKQWVRTAVGISWMTPSRQEAGKIQYPSFEQIPGQFQRQVEILQQID